MNSPRVRLDSVYRIWQWIFGTHRDQVERFCSLSVLLRQLAIACEWMTSLWGDGVLTRVDHLLDLGRRQTQHWDKGRGLSYASACITKDRSNAGLQSLALLEFTLWVFLLPFRNDDTRLFSFWESPFTLSCRSAVPNLGALQKRNVEKRQAP